MAEPTDLDPSDDALVAAAREGKVRAFEALLDRHEARVLRILRLLGIASQDREDVAQEFFSRLFRHLNGYRPGRSFEAWLYRVTSNAAHDHRVRLGRRSQREIPWAEGLAPAETERGPAEIVEGGEIRQALERALASLSDRERAVFVLRELEELETAEVARALGISTITVRRHLSLARRRLRTILRESGAAKTSTS